MVVIRPVAPEDLDQLLGLAQLTSFGLTTLPKDRVFLKNRIEESRRSFAHMADRPGGEAYLFVMEDLKTGSVVGTCGVVSKVGGFEPFYAYRVETSVHESKMLNVRKEVRTLHLVAEHNGPCEIGSLFLKPEYRGGGNGRLLSRARFLFMAQHRQRMDPTVIAEMRGVIDGQGRSAFWDAVGKHFFEIDFPKADYLSIINKRFIADLMPRHPIYIPLLPGEAQAVIGEVHEQTRGALKILQSEGFEASGMVDIFEAGPVVICELEKIRTVRESFEATVAEVVDHFPAAGGAPEGEGGRPCIVANTPGGGMDFRCCQTAAVVLDGRISLPGTAALALGVKVGGKVLVAGVGAGSASGKGTGTG